MATWCNVEIHNDVDNQQFSSLKFSVWEAALVLSQHDKSVMLPRAVYLDESCLFTSTRWRTLLPFTTRPRLACLNCKPDSYFFRPPCDRVQFRSGRTGHGRCHLLSFLPPSLALPVCGTQPYPDKSNSSSAMQWYNLFSSLTVNAWPWSQKKSIHTHHSVACRTLHQHKYMWPTKQHSIDQQEDGTQENETGRTLSKTSWTASINWCYWNQHKSLRIQDIPSREHPECVDVLKAMQEQEVAINWPHAWRTRVTGSNDVGLVSGRPRELARQVGAAA